MKDKIKPTDKYKIEDYYQCECGRKFYKSLSLSSHFAHCEKHHKVLGYDICNYHKNHKGCMSGWQNKAEKEIKEIHKKSQDTLIKRIKSGEIKGTWHGKHLSEEHKDKIRKARCEFLSDENSMELI